MTSQQLRDAVAEVKMNGPTRVVTNEHGNATTPAQARESFGIVVDAVLIRNDGWSLGFSEKFRDVAESLWAGDWVAELDTIYGGDVTFPAK